MVTRDNNKHRWSHGLLRCIQRLGVIENLSDILQEDQTALNKIAIGDIDRGISKITDIDRQYLSTMNTRNRGDNQGDGIKSLKYATWMMSEDSSFSASYTNLLNNIDDIKCIPVARLRLRAHNLSVESDRSNPRSSRICRCCARVVDGRRVVEDEMHFMLECPLYSDDRKLFFEKQKNESALIDKNFSMKRFMNPESFEGWKRLIKSIEKCNDNRKLK